MYSLRLKYILLILCCYTTCLSSCQTKRVLTDEPIQPNIDYLLEGQFKFLDRDRLANIYLVSEANEILQIKDDKILFRYSNKRLGDITKIDVSNPQKILVYYGDYYQVVFLDNTLSAIKQLDLEAMGYWDVNGVALSRDNQIWIYDPVNLRLMKINELGKVQLSSNELFNYGISKHFYPDILVDEELIYVYDDNVIHLFDEFGLWKRQVSVDNEGLDLANGYLIYKYKDQLLSYSIELQLQEPKQVICTVKDKVADFFITKERIYLIDEKGLFVENL